MTDERRESEALRYHADADGSVLLGTEEPVHILQRGATVAEIANLAALAVVDAETRPRQTELDP